MAAVRTQSKMKRSITSLFKDREKEIKKTLLENQREEEEAMILSHHQRVILPNNG